jgi:hypothetical protein
MMGTKETERNWQISKSKMAAGCHLKFRLNSHNFRTVCATNFKFHTDLVSHHGNKGEWSKLTNFKIQDGRRPPSWISVKCRNFRTEWARNFKFHTDLENHHGNKLIDQNWQISKLRMGASRRLEFRLNCHNFRTEWARKFKFHTDLEMHQENTVHDLDFGFKHYRFCTVWDRYFNKLFGVTIGIQHWNKRKWSKIRKIKL